MAVTWLFSIVFTILSCSTLYCGGQDKLTLNPQLGGQQGNPGFQIRISSKGLTYANTVAGNLLNSELEHIELPNVRKSIKKGYVEAKNMQLSEFQPLIFSYSLNAPNGLVWSTQGGKIAVEGDWKLKTKLWFMRISESGTFTVSASDLRLSVSAEFKNSNGKPQLGNIQCNADIGSISFRPKGGGVVGDILNLFREKVSDRLKDSLERSACRKAKKFIEDDTNTKLNTFPMSKKLSRWFQFDYSLISDPQMISGGLMSFHKGEIRHTRSKALYFYPHDMQIQTSNSKMLYFYVSDHILNSFLSEAHKYGKIDYTIDKNTEPKFSKYLQTSCGLLEMCLNFIFPSIGEKYPNSTGSLRFVTTNPHPTVVFSTGKANMRVQGKIFLYVQSGSSEKIEVLQADVSVSAHVIPELHTEVSKITGVAVIDDLRVSVVRSTMEDVSDSVLQDEMDWLVKPLLEAMANKHLSQGFDIPLTRGVGISNMGLQFLNRTVELSADVNYHA